MTMLGVGVIPAPLRLPVVHTPLQSTKESLIALPISCSSLFFFHRSEHDTVKAQCLSQMSSWREGNERGPGSRGLSWVWRSLRRVGPSPRRTGASSSLWVGVCASSLRGETPVGEAHGQRTDSSWNGTSEPKATHADASSLCPHHPQAVASTSSPWLQGAHLALLPPAPQAGSTPPAIACGSKTEHLVSTAQGQSCHQAIS